MHLCPHRREEAEGASELTHGDHPQDLPIPGPSGTLGVRLGSDALGVHSNQWIRNFDEACVPPPHSVFTLLVH